MDFFTLGLTFVVLGLGLWLIVLLLQRVVAKHRLSAQLEQRSNLPLELTMHDEAVVLVGSGGYISYLNEQARELFNLGVRKPNLELMARQTEPRETFYSLCATEGQAQFSINGRLVDGVSYFVPHDSSQDILVSLKRLYLLPEAEQGDAVDMPVFPSSQAIRVFSKLSQKISANLDLDATLLSVLHSVESLTRSDFHQVKLWKADTQTLTSYHLSKSSHDFKLEKVLEEGLVSQSYTEYHISKRKALLIPNTASSDGLKPSASKDSTLYKSYLGVPLDAPAGLVGTLELYALQENNFSESDLETLRILSGQVAFAIHNSLRYEDEQRRALELAGLADMAQIVGAQRTTENVYEQLVKSVINLLDVEILGFLVFDEQRGVIEGKAPIIGLHEDVLEWTNIPIPEGSQAQDIWSSQQMIVSNDAPNDELLGALGLNNLAVAAGIRQLVLAPLTSGGRGLGYLLAGDKRDSSGFSQDDLRLLSIITGQATAIIENAILAAETHQRVLRAETLRRIASLTGSTANLDEILKYSLRDLARLLQADYAAVFLLDGSRGEVRFHKSSLFGVPEETASQLGRLPVDDPQYHRTVSGSQQLYFGCNVKEDDRVLPVYKPIIQSLEVQSAIVAPLILRGRSLGEVMLGSQKINFFSQGDVGSVETASDQLAGAIDRANLYIQTDESLRLRVEQLTAVTRVSRELNTSLELRHLLQRVYDEVIKTTGADCGTILLFQQGDPELGADLSSSERVALHIGDPPIPNLHPLERAVLERGEAIVVNDFEQTVLLRKHGRGGIPPTYPAHGGVRSALVVPIAYQERIAGLIHLHAQVPNRFDERAKEIAEILAIQAAIALGNAYRYQEQVRRTESLNRRVATLAHLLETTQNLRFDETLEESLTMIAEAIQASTPFNSVLISVYNPESTSLLRTTGVGISKEDMEELRAHPQAWSSLQNVLKPEFRVGGAYFIPYEKMPVIPAEVHTLTILPLEGTLSAVQNQVDSIWHPEDMLVVPLHSTDGLPLGLVSVDAPRDNLRPDRPTIESIEIFSSQASLFIESHRRITELQAQYLHAKQELESVQRTSQDTQEALPRLVEKDLEQTLQIQQLSQRAQDLRWVVDVLVEVTTLLDWDAVLVALGNGLMTHLEMESIMIVENDAGRPRLIQVQGTLPSDANIEALLGQKNPLVSCLQTGASLSVPDIEANPDWSNSPLLQQLRAGAFLCLPLKTMSGREVAILAARNEAHIALAGVDFQTIEKLAQQVGGRLSNLETVTEASQHLQEVNLLLDFNRRLLSLEPASVLQTLLESAMQVLPVTQAGLVLLWKASQGRLVPQAAKGYSNPDRIVQIAYRPGEALPGQVFASGEGVRLGEVDFAYHYNLSPEDLLAYQDATGGKLPVSTLVLPIVGSSHNHPLGVLVLENFRDAAAFTDEMQMMVMTLCQQAALNLENTRLYQATEERASQLHALTQVAAAISSELLPEELMTTLLDQLREILPYETGTLWIFREDQVEVRAARGFGDEEERVGLTAAVEDSVLLSEMISNSEPICVGDIREDKRFPALFEPHYLSWLGVPLIAGGEVIGVIALEKTEANFYTPEHIQLATTFAGQAAVALANAHLFQESISRTNDLDQRSQRLDMLNRLSSRLGQTLDQENILAVTLEELTQAVSCSGITAVLFDADETAWAVAEQPRTEDRLPLALPQVPLFDRLRQTLGIFNAEDISREELLAPLESYLENRGARSLLALPMATGNVLHGLLLVQTERLQRFSADEIDLARTISNQAAIAVQNARLYKETRDLTTDLERRVSERTTELAHEHRRTETLLRILTELSSSLDLEQVLDRTLKLILDIVDAGQITVLVERPGEDKLHRLASVGYAEPAPMGGSPTPFNTDQGLAGWVITKAEAALIDDLNQDPRWILLSDAPQPQHRSAIAAPLVVGKEALGVLMLYHEQVGHFSRDQLELIQATANQIAVAINNAELYRLIRDQAEDLGNMVRNQQVEASRSRAILEAVADGVLVTDATRRITLFNASAGKILGLEGSDVIGRSLEHFSGLFGRAARPWMATIQTWSNDPASLESGKTYAEQITLEDERVVSVHLSPVSLYDAFLGTVSIFRDITHQVEIDRLKSEFVATVSHELRTPMTSIRGYVDLMMMGASGDLNEQQNQFLDIIKDNTDRLNILVDDLLDISRIEAGRVSLSIQPLDLREVVESALDDMQRRSQDDQKAMEFQIESSPELPIVLGDMERVRQIVENLLENAYYYTAKEGTIITRLRGNGKQVQVEVRDNGIGIPPEVQPLIFERFYRGEHPFVLATSGTGLGLSIVQHLVEMHQGRIWLESSGVPGEGSTFFFTLPVYNPESS